MSVHEEDFIPEELQDQGHGFCPDCGHPLTNSGAASRGDGDIYDEIVCDMCQEVKEERHAAYCKCVDCNPYGMDDDDVDLTQNCPNCGREYDDIDYEYQICSHCKYNNNIPTPPATGNQ